MVRNAFMKNWEAFAPPGMPEPDPSLCEIVLTTSAGEEVSAVASYRWEVLAKLRNAMDRGHTDFHIRPISKERAREIDPGQFV